MATFKCIEEGPFGSIDKLKEGCLDAAMLNLINFENLSSNIDYMPICTIREAAVMSNKHPLSNKTLLSIGDLKDERIFIPHPQLKDDRRWSAVVNKVTELDTPHNIEYLHSEKSALMMAGVSTSS
jgi:hypothetical protein